jgi:hypothetical protein
VVIEKEERKENKRKGKDNLSKLIQENLKLGDP